jgi:hypothetical protein
MKRAAKAPKTKRDREMLPEYDFSQGERGKYSKRYAEGTNVIVLSPDLAEFFPDSESVNSALRALVDIVRRKDGISHSRRSGASPERGAT